MSLLTDILTDVYKLTSRPDLIVETTLAVKQATLSAHRSEKYRRDIQESLIPCGKPSNGSAIYQLDIPTYFPNYRQFAYLRPYDSVTQSASSIVLGPDSFIAPDAIMDPYNEQRVNVAYTAGNNVNIILEAAYDSFLCGYYKNPIVNPDANYESWIARDFPTLIVMDAAMRIFNDIEMPEAATKLKDLLFGKSGDYHNVIGGEYMLLKTSCLEDGGR